MHERECKGYISFNRGVNELNRGVNELNRGVNHSVARQGCNLLRAAVTSAVTSQGCCCGNLQIHPLDLGHISMPSVMPWENASPYHFPFFIASQVAIQPQHFWGRGKSWHGRPGNHIQR